MKAERKCKIGILAAGTALTAAFSLALPVGTISGNGISDGAPSGNPASVSAAESSGKVTLRIANWEEYIDEGGWDEEEAIDLDDRESTVILGENSMIEDFEEWYLDTYGVEVEVEYTMKYIEVLRRLGQDIPDLDEQMCHIIASGMFNGVFEIVVHDMPGDKALRYVDQLRDFYTAGWLKLMGQ